MRLSKNAPRLVVVLCACGLLCVSGCGGLKTVPVSGIATLDGKPLNRGLVLFNPDASKGGNTRFACRGRIDGNGQYEVYMDDGTKVIKGAPVGWYKVTIVTLLPGNDTPIPVHPKFTEESKTPLVIEVVDNPQPGAYDLKFTK